MPLPTRVIRILRLITSLVTLFGSAAHAEIVSDNFNNGSTNPALWTGSQGVVVRGANEDGFLDGHALWFGQYGLRLIETRPFNTLGGGTVSFSIRLGDGSRPWWDPISWWRNRAYFGYQLPGDPEWRIHSSFSSRRGRSSWRWTEWQHLTFSIPPIARSYDTRFAFWQGPSRWLQRHRDHWAIDNVAIEALPGGTTWSHPLPSTVELLRGRTDASGQYHAILRAAAPFRLGAFPGTTGLYLLRVATDGTWDLLTPLPTFDRTANVYDLAVDGSGNAVVCGSYTTPVFGLPASPSSPDAFVAKFSPTHQLLWARAGFNSTTSEASYRGLCLGPAGEVTVAGRFHQFMRFGPAGHIGEPELTSGDQNASLVARYDADGNYQWARRLGDHPDTDPQIVWGIRSDPAGNLYTFGRYYGTLRLSDHATVASPPGLSNPSLGFVAKLAPAGGVHWVANLGACAEVRGVAADAGGLFAAGLFNSSYFAPEGAPVDSPHPAGVFLARLNPADGAAEWTRTSSSAGDDTLTPGECLALDGNGRPHLANTFGGDSTVAGQAVRADPGFNLLLTRWNTDGTLSWRKRAGTGTIASMAVDPLGQTLLTGSATGLAAFESNAVLAAPEANFLHRFNSITEPTHPVGVGFLRSGIPANTPGSASLGILLAKDADGAGTYRFDLVPGSGATHNALFKIGGDAGRELLLADGLRLVPGDRLSARVAVTDETGTSAESLIPFTVGPPTTIEWATSFGDVTIRDCTTGPSGELFITGYFLGTLEFGPWSIDSEGGADFFLAKVNPDGSPAWVLGGGSSGLDRGHGIDVDSDGNCYLCGIISGDSVVNQNGNRPISSFGGFGIEYSDLLVASFDSDGFMRWIVTSGSTDTDSAEGIVHDDVNDRTYVTGYFRGTAEFSGYALRHPFVGSSGIFTGPTQPSGGSDSAFVACYDGIGALEWVRFATGPDEIRGHDVAVDSTGAAYATGKFRKTASFNGIGASTPDANTAFPAPNAFLWKLLPNGANGWLRHGGVSNKADEGLFVGTDASDRITMAGRSNGSAFAENKAEFGAVSLPLSDGWDPIVVTFDSNGLPLSGHIFEGQNQDQLHGFEVFPDGSVMLAANVDEMDDAPLAAPATFLQLDANGNLAWSSTLAPALDCATFGSDLSPHAAGSFSGSVEVAGEVLTTGSTYAARLAGPAPSSQPPATLTLTSPSLPAPLTADAKVATKGNDKDNDDPSYDASIDENIPAGSIVATLLATDPDSSSLIYQFVEGDGDHDNDAFDIVAGKLVMAVPPNFEEQSEYRIRLRVVDETRETLERSFRIAVNDLPDAIPTAIALSDLVHVYDGQPHGATATTSPQGVPLTVTYDGGSTQPTAAGSYAAVAAVDHPDYAGTAAETFWVHTPVQHWLASYFPNEQINDPALRASLWGDTADPDRDGIDNRSEAYYGSDPSLPYIPDQGFEIRAVSLDDTHQLLWTRNKDAVTAPMIPQWSLDLENWFSSGDGPPGDTRIFTLSTETDLGTRETVHATLPRKSEPAIFLRLGNSPN